MDHLANLLAGLRDALFSPWERGGYHVDRRGFQTDMANLRGDFMRVGADMRAVLKRDQQANPRARKR